MAGHDDGADEPALRAPADIDQHCCAQARHGDVAHAQLRCVTPPLLILRGYRFRGARMITPLAGRAKRPPTAAAEATARMFAIIPGFHCLESRRR